MAGLVGALRAMLSLDSTQFVSGADRAQKRAKKLEGSLAGLSGTMRKVGLGLAAAAAGLGVAIKGQLNAADELGKAAQKFGVGVEELSRLKYAADLSDVSLDTLGTSLGRLSKLMVTANGGNKAAAETFRAIGVSVTDASGQLRSSESVLQDVADVMAKMPDGAEKTALAMKLFGKSGAEMIPMLNSGKSGLQAMADEANRLGVVIDAKTAKSAENFNDNLTRLKSVLGGLGVQMAAKLAPYLEQFTNYLIDLTQNQFPKFISDIRIIYGYYSAKISNAFSEFKARIAAIGTSIAEKWEEIKTSIGGAIEYVQGLWDTFVGSLSAAIQTAKDAGKAIADALSTGRDEMNSGTGAPGMVSAADEFGGGMFTAGAGGVQGGQMMGAAIVNGIVLGGVEALKARQRELADMFGQIVQIAKDRLRIRSPSQVFRDEVGARITEGLALGIKDNKPLVDTAMDEVGDAIEGKADSFKSAFESMRSTMKSAFSGLVTGALNFRDALSQVIGKLADMLANSAFEGLMGAGGDGLLGGFLKMLGFADGGAFQGGRVLAFANGGVVSGATAFAMQGGLGVMGEAGPEAIMPLARGRGGKLGVMAHGGGPGQLQIQITENPMFAARVEGISNGQAVKVTRAYDREAAPQTRNRNPRERG